jgi:hypothetical protein
VASAQVKANRSLDIGFGHGSTSMIQDNVSIASRQGPVGGMPESFGLESCPLGGEEGNRVQDLIP